MVLKWQWVRNFWFRIIHCLMIATVVVEALLGVSCPLTDWEDMLREKAGETVAQGTFIGRMLHRILFWDATPGTMTIIYCLFGLAVLLALLLHSALAGQKTQPEVVGRTGAFIQIYITRLFSPLNA